MVLTVPEAAGTQARALTVGELAERVSGCVEGDGDALIIGVSSIEEAEGGDIVFAESQKFLASAARSRASAIVGFLEASTPGKPLIKVENPRFAFTQILSMFSSKPAVAPGAHPTALLGREVSLGDGAGIGPYCVIGDGVRIGAGSVVMSGCHIGDGARIGDDAMLYPNVTLYGGTILGRGVILHSGVVIGADGFGYMRIGDRSVKVPHVGTVEIGDEVEIGANSTIDRAKTGVTLIGARTKIDNLVHIAHNVKIGEDCVIVAQVGIAGSTQLGRGVMFAGQSGVKDHILVGDGAVVLARAGVIGNVPAGAVYSGFPARPHRAMMRLDAMAGRLPEYVDRIRALEVSVQRLSAANEELACKVARTAEGLDSQDEAAD